MMACFLCALTQCWQFTATAHANAIKDLSFDLNRYAGQNVVIVDGTINWFAAFWYLDKYAVVYRLPVFDFYKLLLITPKGKNPIDVLMAAKISGFYYIFAVADSVMDGAKRDNQSFRQNMELLAKELEQAGAVPQEIENPAGETAFKIYYYKL